MSPQGREAGEAAIARVLLEQWDPLAVREGAAPRESYATFAHDVYNLLVRGASDVQVERHLRHVERDDLHHPELGERDLAAVVRALRDVERTL
jgi:hypothetical protein